MTNLKAIEMNNSGLVALKAGNVIGAYELLSTASNITMQGVASHEHVDSKNSTYRFHWEDCSLAFSKSSASRGLGGLASTFEGCVPFLFLRGLRITTPVEELNVDELCPCGFAWAVWYNLALCCSLLGTRLGDRGQALLKSAFQLYQKVQRRVENEPPSRHWKILEMAVTNNQACIYHDFSMRDATVERLQKLASTLLSSPDLTQGDVQKGFFLTLQILGNDNLAAAA